MLRLLKDLSLVETLANFLARFIDNSKSATIRIADIDNPTVHCWIHVCVLVILWMFYSNLSQKIPRKSIEFPKIKVILKKYENLEIKIIGSAFIPYQQDDRP